MLYGVNRLNEERENIHLIQDEEGHWKIGERPQQESDRGHIEPLYIHIGAPHIDHFAIDERADIHHPKVGIIGIGDTQKELIDVLQHIVAEEGHRGIIIVGANLPTSLERKNATLGDFAHMLIEETKEEIFMITNTLEKIEDIELKIEEHNKFNQKQAQKYHKFHNQKPRGPQGQYARRGRK